jgi:hypothetical protein
MDVNIFMILGPETVAIMLSAVMLNGIMLSVVILNVIKLNVMAPLTMSLKFD